MADYKNDDAYYPWQIVVARASLNLFIMRLFQISSLVAMGLIVILSRDKANTLEEIDFPGNNKYFLFVVVISYDSFNNVGLLIVRDGWGVKLDNLT